MDAINSVFFGTPNTVPLDQVYKVFQMKANRHCSRVIIFNGNDKTTLNLVDWFSDIEIAYIEKYKVPIVFSNNLIYSDDTIGTIKWKVLNALNDKLVSYPEMYLYAKQTSAFNLFDTYQKITHNDRNVFRPNMLAQLLRNLHIDQGTIDSIPVLEEYTFDILFKYISKSSYVVNTPIGQKFASFTDLLYPADPYDIVSSSENPFQQTVDNNLITFENDILIQYGKLDSNNLYLCTLPEVLTYAETIGMTDDYIIRLYYPIISSREISTKEGVDENRQTFLDEDIAVQDNTEIKQYNADVDTLYNIYNKRTSELNVTKKGVKQIAFVMHPETSTNLPLEVIFKNIHSSKEVPFVKYNPGSRQENLYRLYCEKMTKGGNKIPILKRTTIVNLSKMSMQSEIFLYIIHSKTTNLNLIICSNGNIRINASFMSGLSATELDLFFKETMNGIIDKLNVFLQSTGYKINPFISTYHSLVEVTNIDYIFEVSAISNTINFEPILHGLTTIFEINEHSSSGPLFMKYKRVDNYTKMSAIQSMITSIYPTSSSEQEVVDALILNFNLSAEQAVIEFTNYLNGFNKINGRYVNKSFEILQNNGFNAGMQYLKADNKLVVTITDIDNIGYVRVLDIYMDSFCRIMLNPTSTAVPADDIKRLCTDKRRSILMNKHDLIIPVVKMQDGTQVTSGALDIDNVIQSDRNVIFFGDDEDEDFEEEEEELDEADNQLIQDLGILADKPQKTTPVISEKVDSDPVENIRNVIFFDDDEDEDEEGSDEDDAEVGSDEDAEVGSDEDAEVGSDEDAEVGSDEEAEVGSDEEEGSDEEVAGGAKTKAVVAKEKKNENPFYRRLLDREPELILVRKVGKYKAYSRVCPANVNRQPIILTNKEKEAIDENNRDAYGYALRYGHSTDKTDQHWLICPRFWCNRTNMPLTEKDAKDPTKCAKEDIHEFTGKYHKKDDGSYKENNPGLVLGAHPTHGVPCCFGKGWNSEQLKGAREEMGITDDDIDVPVGEQGVTDNMKKKKEDISEQNNFYIVGFDKFPVPKQRWGFLPPSVLLFLDINYTDVLSKKSSAFIKSNKKTFLRYGVESNQHQSFIGCIADIYASVNKYKENKQPVPSIKTMREILVGSITLDMYLQYQNGSLVALFQPKRRRLDKDILTKYEDTQFYKSLTPTDDAQMNFYEDTVSSFERFLEYLRDDDALIDHTYIWDIVTSVNSKLFPTGLNLILLEIQDNDITDNVELICPTNSHALTMYDASRETVIILKHDVFYEPVYLYEIIEDETDPRGKVVRSKETFVEQTATPVIKRVLKIIQNTIGKYCKPRPSLPKVYNYQTNIIASKLSTLLKTYGYIIQFQIVNYRRKVIGFLVNDDSSREWSVFIPSFPSAILPDVKVKYTDDIKWADYSTTRDMLSQIHNTSNQTILCRPILKVIEDEMIVGILTETNQFVQIDPPTSNIEDGIDVIHTTGYASSGYTKTDKQLATNRTEDKVRLETIHNIKLEGQFYSAFRTVLRIALGQPSNYETRQRIVSSINNASHFTYSVVVNKIEWLIRGLLRQHVSFANYKPSVLTNLKDISDVEALYTKKQYCLVADDGVSCKIVIPKTNLITAKDNSIIYFKRVADELLRYKQVRLFVLEPKRYLNVGNSEYKLNENELLMLQTTLDGDYLDNLIPIQASEYVKNVTFDAADPSISQPYSTIVTIEQQNKVAIVDDSNIIYNTECILETKRSVIGNGQSYWPRVFPQKCKEIIFNNTINCTYHVLVNILNKRLKQQVSTRLIKQALWQKYSMYLPTYQAKIFQILQTHPAKRAMIEKVKNSQMKFEDLIMSEEYFITNLDLWAVADHFGLPILLFANNSLDTLGLSVNWVVLSGNAKLDSYYCIRSPAYGIDIPEYHMIDPMCKLMELKGFDKMIDNPTFAENNLNFDTYLNTHTLKIDV